MASDWLDPGAFGYPAYREKLPGALGDMTAWSCRGTVMRHQGGLSNV